MNGAFPEESANEILLTSFHDVRDNVEAQCEIVRWLGKAGEVGFVLYYVGIIMPRIDPLLIDACNEVGCALICMPKNDPSCRYGELLAEGTQAILENQMSASQLVNEVLSRMAGLPENQNNMETVFRMVCDRLHATFVLIDHTRHILYTAAWPHDSGGNMRAFLQECNFPETGGSSTCSAEGILYYLYNIQIFVSGHTPMNLLIKKANAKISRDYLLQIQLLIQLSMDIWANNSPDLLYAEMTAAIFCGDTDRARELESYVNFSLEDVDAAWLLHRIPDSKILSDVGLNPDIAKVFLEGCGLRFLADLWEDSIIVLLCTKSILPRADVLLKQFLAQNPDLRNL